MKIKYLVVSENYHTQEFETYELASQHQEFSNDRSSKIYAILGTIPTYRTEQEATEYVEKEFIRKNMLAERFGVDDNTVS